jgi:hypothetical protein
MAAVRCGGAAAAEAAAIARLLPPPLLLLLLMCAAPAAAQLITYGAREGVSMRRPLVRPCSKCKGALVISRRHAQTVLAPAPLTPLPSPTRRAASRSAHHGDQTPHWTYMYAGRDWTADEAYPACRAAQQSPINVPDDTGALGAGRVRWAARLWPCHRPLHSMRACA